MESPAGSGYCLVWSEEFRGASLDLDKWSYERNCYGGGNNEAQCYVDAPANVRVDGEYLHITAIREDTRGPAVNDDAPEYDPADTSGSGTFSSGRVRTIGKGDWRYGRFEIRAKLPQGQGTWPAVWMLPTDWVYGGWAASGEIDIMEAVNLKVGGEDRVHGTLHYGGEWPHNTYSGAEYQLPGGANPADDFHEYALEWEAGEIRWYVDGVHFATQTQDGWYSANTDEPGAPFDQRFHLIINLAVGGDWAGNTNDTGIDESAFPQTLSIDYVRVYQCQRDPETGRGCATRGDAPVVPGNPPPPPLGSGMGDFLLFDGGITAPYAWYTYTADGSVDFVTVNAGGTYGSVGQASFSTDQGIGFLQSPAAVDLRGFSAIEFDVRLAGGPARPLVFRADCGYPCTSGDYPLGAFTLGEWRRVRIELAELASAGLNLAAVNTPFVISPPAGDQQGAVIEFDNVILKR